MSSLLAAVSLPPAEFDDAGKAGKKGAETAVDEWATFCKKWGYGETQREAIRNQLAGVL